MSSIKCPICEKMFGELTPSHIKTHDLTMAEFKKLYPNTHTYATLPKYEPKPYNTYKRNWAK